MKVAKIDMDWKKFKLYYLLKSLQERHVSDRLHDKLLELLDDQLDPMLSSVKGRNFYDPNVHASLFQVKDYPA